MVDLGKHGMKLHGSIICRFYSNKYVLNHHTICDWLNCAWGTWKQRANIKLYLDIQLHGGPTFPTPCVIQMPSVTCDPLFAFFHFQNAFDTSMMMHVSISFLTSSHTVCVFLCQSYITKHNTHWVYPCCCK